jgi:asparagine synthase (glutamine-hydrolysing)
MCGLIAALGRIDLTHALTMMQHRGSRHQKIVETRWGSVGHVRLPIVGTSEDHDQPVQRHPWTIAFVGEILDFRETHPGMECDVELVRRIWCDLGPRGFADRDGFWSIVALDARDGSLHALVDYLAQKPLYYRKDMPAIASEPDALVELAHVELCPIYMSSVIKWGYCPDAFRTPYKNIYRMAPGSHLKITQDGQYSYEHIDVLKPVDASPVELKWAIEGAVKRRVKSSDVPVAALVSGGLDSAIAYTLARQHGDVHAYHVQQDDEHAALTEGNAVRQVVPEHKLTVIKLEPPTIEKALLYMQEPIDLGSLYPQVALSDAIRRSGPETVCLTGDGADELFGGYGRAERYDSQGSDIYHELVSWHLPRLDRVMMRNAIEVRSPFLARGVVKIALGLPYEARRGKKILREIFRDVLPKGVAETPKIPLRTAAVDRDREAESIKLVKVFEARHAQ